MNRLKHTKGPWSKSANGSVICKNHPVCDITHGDWGDEYPAIRLVGNSTCDFKAEAYMEKSSYGNVPTEESHANASLIAASPEMIDLLLHLYVNYEMPYGTMDIDTKKRFNEVIEKATGMTIEEIHHEATCYICKDKIESIAGNPSLWGVRLPYKGGDGKYREYHVGCLANIVDKSNGDSNEK